MKKKILTLGMVLTLVAVLVAPNAVLAVTTEVTGDVIEGYTFTAPSPIALGSMSPGTYASGSSTDGSLVGNDPDGYTVTGTDQNPEVTAGYMLIKGTGTEASPEYILDIKQEISNEDASYVNADDEKTFVDTSGATDVAVSLYVDQWVTYSDTVATGYSITITFTVTPKA